MADERVHRRLAAILAADVVGYSRLMSRDEEGTLARLTALRGELLAPCIGEHGGRIFKTTGDGLLAEFASAVDSVRCAAAIQAGMRARNEAAPDDRRIELRIGVNLGDVILDHDDDVYGDGVNVAARLEGLAPAGTVIVSEAVHQQVKGRLDLAFEDLGPRPLKNIDGPVRVFRLRDGGAAARSSPRQPDLHQDIRFCRAPDGARLAYAAVGDGPPLVKAANWLNHLEYDWESPVFRSLLHALARRHRLVRYDERGNGLSDWEVGDISFEAFVSDLETVVDHAGLDRFDLFGISQGCPVSIAYAVRHPERVRRMVLCGGFAAGWRARGDPDEIVRREAMVTLTRAGWGQDNAAFRQVFTSLYLPGATADQAAAWNELQRLTTSPANAARLQHAFSEIDVRPILRLVAVPTLVLHSRGDAAVPLAAGRQLASEIPGARFVTLDSGNHIVLDHEPAWSRLVEEMGDFLAAPETKPA